MDDPLTGDLMFLSTVFPLGELSPLANFLLIIIITYHEG